MRPWCQEHKDLQERHEVEEEVHPQGLEVVLHEVLEELEVLQLLLWLQYPPLHAWPVPHVPVVMPRPQGSLEELASL